MEKTMREFVAMLGGGDEIVTKDDLGALLNSLRAPSAYDRLSDEEADAKNEAQQIAFDAMEAESETQARKLAKRALRLDPDCVDALVVMTELDARTPREVIGGLQKAVEAGERSLGAKFIREEEGHFWMLIETRPWMRAMAELAAALKGAGLHMDAIRIYERMLKLNPNDNQGVRDPLLGLYLAVNHLTGAGRLLDKYKEDAMANFAWGRVLERFLVGDHAAARAALEKARKANHFVEQYMTAKIPVPEKLPEMYSPGSKEEAVLCMDAAGFAWAQHRDAVFWLLDQCAADGARPLSAKRALTKAQAHGRKVQ
jgi:tetratricopeptide (TPR) repeat protein